MSETPSALLRDIASYNSYYVTGVLLNWGLYGALCAQVYLYYLAFPKDRTINKILVCSVYFFESVQAILLLYKTTLIYNFSSRHNSLFSINPPHLLSAQASLTILYVATPLMGGIVAFVVQSYYAYRLRILARSWIIMAVIMTLALVQLIGAVIGINENPLPLPGNVMNNAGLLLGIFSMVCDSLIAAAMTYFLLRNDSDWKSTHAVLVKLVRLALETGTVTVIIAIIYLSLFYVYTDPVETTPFLILGKVYSNTMMVNLNHRIQFAGDENDTISAYSMPTICMPPNPSLNTKDDSETQEEQGSPTRVPSCITSTVTIGTSTRNCVGSSPS